jgi:hypothetical protein
MDGYILASLIKSQALRVSYRLLRKAAIYGDVLTLTEVNASKFMVNLVS